MANPTDLDIIEMAFRGMSGSLQGLSGNTTGTPGLYQICRQVLRRRRWVSFLSDNATAATAAPENVAFMCEVPMQLIAVNVVTPVAVTANDTNFATILVQKRPNATPGTPATAWSLNTQTIGTSPNNSIGTTVAWGMAANAAASTIANLQALAKDIFTVQATKGGTGVVLSGAYNTASSVAVELVSEDL